MRFLVSFSAHACLVASIVSCGGSSSAGGPSDTGPNAFVITITSPNGAQSFAPNPASAGGQLVVFRNADSVTHRVLLNDGSIETGDIAPGASSAPVRMPAAGTNYHCPLHPGMVGAVNAQGGAPPPPCEGVYCDGVY